MYKTPTSSFTLKNILRHYDRISHFNMLNIANNKYIDVKIVQLHILLTIKPATVRAALPAGPPARWRHFPGRGRLVAVRSVARRADSA